MEKRFNVITLCGSTRFKNEFVEENKRLTLEGYVVISVGCFGHSGDVFTDEQKVMLDKMHKQKIDMADSIFVINKDGYIGDSTKSEISYARFYGKEIVFMEDKFNDVVFEQDGDMLCCHAKDGFVNIQESTCGFGSTKSFAYISYIADCVDSGVKP